jgi:hypothetical protein
LPGTSTLAYFASKVNKIILLNAVKLLSSKNEKVFVIGFNAKIVPASASAYSN